MALHPRRRIHRDTRQVPARTPAPLPARAVHIPPGRCRQTGWISAVTRRHHELVRVDVEHPDRRADNDHRAGPVKKKNATISSPTAARPRTERPPAPSARGGAARRSSAPKDATSTLGGAARRVRPRRGLPLSPSRPPRDCRHRPVRMPRDRRPCRARSARPYICMPFPTSARQVPQSPSKAQRAATPGDLAVPPEWNRDRTVSPHLEPMAAVRTTSRPPPARCRAVPPS